MKCPRWTLKWQGSLPCPSRSPFLACFTVAELSFKLKCFTLSVGLHIKVGSFWQNLGFVYPASWSNLDGQSSAQVYTGRGCVVWQRAAVEPQSACLMMVVLGCPLDGCAWMHLRKSWSQIEIPRRKSCHFYLEANRSHSQSVQERMDPWWTPAPESWSFLGII